MTTPDFDPDWVLCSKCGSLTAQYRLDYEDAFGHKVYVCNPECPPRPKPEVAAGRVYRSVFSMVALAVVSLACVLTTAGGQLSNPVLTRPTAIVRYMTVNTYALNLRACPSTSCAADPKGLRYGDVITVMPAQRRPAHWLYGRTADGRSGWVNAAYLR